MIIKSKNVWIDEEFIPASLEIIEGRIERILPYRYSDEAIDYGDKFILPGLISIHDHGSQGNSANRGTFEEMDKWSLNLLKEGVTTFYPTISTITLKEMEIAMVNLARFIEGQERGARARGMHVEGIFLSPEKAGAHNIDLLHHADVNLFIKWQHLAKGNIKLLSIAPEIDENFRLIKAASEAGVVISLAHTNASFYLANEAILYGAKSFTHLFNAMSGIHHRKPGTVTAGLVNDDVYCELICDGHHVDFNVGQLVCRCKPDDKLIAITDAVPFKDLVPGDYNVDDMGLTVTIDNKGHISLADGTLAGSSAKMHEMVNNIHKQMGQPYKVAIKAATINPACLLGIDDQVGLIQEGYQADLIVTDDNFRVESTYVAGVLEFRLK